MHLTLDITPRLLAFSCEHKAPGPTTLRLRSVYSSTPGLRLKLQGPSAKNTKPPSGAHAFFPALLEIQLAHVRNPATYWSIFWSIGFFMNYGKLWQTMANYGCIADALLFFHRHLPSKSSNQLPSQRSQHVRCENGHDRTAISFDLDELEAWSSWRPQATYFSPRPQNIQNRKPPIAAQWSIPPT